MEMNFSRQSVLSSQTIEHYMTLLMTLPSLEPADGFVVRDEVIGAFRDRVVHSVGGTADYRGTRVPEFRLNRHRRVPADHGQPPVLLRQGHPAVLRPQRHRRIIRLPGERRQRSVSRVVETAQTFESIIGERVRGSDRPQRIQFFLKIPSTLLAIINLLSQ